MSGRPYGIWHAAKIHIKEKKYDYQTEFSIYLLFPGDGGREKQSGRRKERWSGSMKALIKYPGSKWRLALRIISRFPEHHSYLEPFFGSGAVLFNKQRSHIETVNDLDGEVVNLFECIRKNPERLARDVYLTPYSRESYEKAYDIARKDSNGSRADGSSDDPFDRALAFCIRLNQGYGFRTTGEKVGWKNDVQGRERAYAARGWCMMPDRIMQAAERLRGGELPIV